MLGALVASVKNHWQGDVRTSPPDNAPKFRQNACSAAAFIVAVCIVCVSIRSFHHRAPLRFARHAKRFTGHANPDARERRRLRCKLVRVTQFAQEGAPTRIPVQRTQTGTGLDVRESGIALRVSALQKSGSE